jgi:hypothetical protein
VSRAGRLRGTLVLAAGLTAGSTTAFPCGFEDPTSVSSARGVLNWAYPNSLHVISAVWRAQQGGLISRDEQPVPVKSLFGYSKATVRLGALRDRLSAVMDRGQAPPAFSMVLIGPVLWTRYEPTGNALNMISHADGPSNGDVVIVTDEPVVAALIEGRVTPQLARQTGLVRLYGSLDAVQDVMSWLDRLSQQVTAKAAD